MKEIRISYLTSYARLQECRRDRMQIIRVDVQRRGTREEQSHGQKDKTSSGRSTKKAELTRDEGR